MGRIIFATRDTGAYERMGRDLRGMTDRMANALCRGEISDFPGTIWPKIMGCSYEQLRLKKDYFFSSFSDNKIRLPDGGTTAASNVAVNQLKLIASEELKLLIHIHLQCEIHAWVAEADRPWFVTTLANAMHQKIIHKDEKLLQFLSDTAKGPIVMSYSVCDEFPNLYDVQQKLFDDAGVPEEEEADVHDVADRLGWTPEKIWDECFTELINNGPKVQLTPDRVKNVYFGDGLTIYDIVEMWREHEAKTAPKEEITNPILKALVEKKET